MCEANAYLEQDGRENLVMEGVYILKPEGGKILLENIFGEQKLVDAALRRISLMEHKIILVPDSSFSV
ncbi:MAG TPA: CooT family nickel-binding protein [Proteobacteria bacterium]|nr:CooT family nickel-binding protein [Pseudomonadota bacterium]